MLRYTDDRTPAQQLAQWLPLPPNSPEHELYKVMDLIVAEFESDPRSVQCFDVSIVSRAKTIIQLYRDAHKIAGATK